MAKAPKTLEDLFQDSLKDVYFAEKKILTALPKMEKAAQNKDLKAAIQKHRSETEGHVDRLEQIFALLDEKPKGKTCPAILGILEEGTEVMEEYKGSPAIDAGIVASAQAVEHYEITRYGTLRAWAKELEMDEAVELLGSTLGEEEATDEALSALAGSAINAAADVSARA